MQFARVRKDTITKSKEIIYWQLRGFWTNDYFCALRNRVLISSFNVLPNAVCPNCEIKQSKKQIDKHNNKQNRKSKRQHYCAHPHNAHPIITIDDHQIIHIFTYINKYASMPTLSLSSTFALCSSSRDTVSVCPCLAAHCNAVHWSCDKNNYNDHYDHHRQLRWT